jgi:hypothetical protein
MMPMCLKKGEETAIYNRIYDTIWKREMRNKKKKVKKK